MITTNGGWFSECFWDHVFMVYVWVESWWSGWWMRVSVWGFGVMLRWFCPWAFDDEWMHLASRFIARRERPSCLSSEGESLIVWRSLRGEVFSYSFLLLPGQLDGVACFNNCPGYSMVTVYSFCAVLRRARSYPSGYSLVWSSKPEWLMLQTWNQEFSPSKIMSWWCMCEWRVGGVDGGWECVSKAGGSMLGSSMSNACARLLAL